MSTFTEFRKGNVFMVFEDEGDRVFVQGQEGVRKRAPFFSGVMSHADAQEHQAKLLSTGFVRTV